MSGQQHDDDEPQLVHDESNWLVSYADMMTLLFGFFVLMYSMSRVDPEQFTVVSKDVAKYFGGKVKDDSGLKAVTKDIKEVLGTYVKQMNPSAESEVKMLGGPTSQTGEKDLEGQAGQDGSGQSSAESEESDVPIDKRVEVTEHGNVLTLKFKGSILFGSGSAQIKPEFEKMLTEVGQKLKASGRVREIKVEGHTDDSPLKSLVFPSNWELSAARASRVVRQMESIGFTSDSLIAEGFGASRPEQPNRDPEGKALKENQALNRRVIVKVEFNPQPVNGDDQTAQYLEKVKSMKNAPKVQVNGSGANQETAEVAAVTDLERQINEAQSRLAEAQKRLKANEEENKKRMKLDQLQKKLEQLNQKAEQAEEKSVPIQVPASDKKPASLPNEKSPE